MDIDIDGGTESDARGRTSERVTDVYRRRSATARRRRETSVHSYKSSGARCTKIEASISLGSDRCSMVKDCVRGHGGGSGGTRTVGSIAKQFVEKFVYEIWKDGTIGIREF